MTRTEPADGTPKDRQAGVPAADPSVDVDLAAAEARDADVDPYFWETPPAPSSEPQPRVQADMLRGAAQYRAHNARARAAEQAQAEALAPAAPPAPAVQPLSPTPPPPEPEPRPVVPALPPTPEPAPFPARAVAHQTAPARPPLPTPVDEPQVAVRQPEQPQPDQAPPSAPRSSFSTYWGPTDEATAPPTVASPQPSPSAPPLGPAAESAAASWNAAGDPSQLPRSVRVAVARAKRAARRKRMAAGAGVVGVAAVVALVSGSLFKSGSSGASDPAQSNKVTLTKTAFASCRATRRSANGVAPQPCQFTATYSGAEPAYLGADILIQTQAGAGGTNLYNPGDPGHGLQITITSASPRATFTTPVAANACPSDAPANTTCYALANELVATQPFNPSSVLQYTVSLDPPASSASGYQGGTAQIIVKTHAVKSLNNALACTAISPSVDPPTAGKSCTPRGTFRWTSP